MVWSDVLYDVAAAIVVVGFIGFFAIAAGATLYGMVTGYAYKPRNNPFNNHQW